MKKMMLILTAATLCRADVVIEDGTKLRVRLEQYLNSATAKKGQEVELSVADDVRAKDTVVIPQGARVIGTVIEAAPKRRMGRAGSLDFSIDRVRTADGRYIPLRHEPTREKGHSSYIKTGALAVGLAVFVPVAAPVALLMKGKDVEVPKGRIFEVFTDARYDLKTEQKAAAASITASSGADDQLALITVNSSEAGAEIAVDGKYMGSAPATLRLPAGAHHFEISGKSQTWKRTLEVSTGSRLNLNATFERVLDASNR